MKFKVGDTFKYLGIRNRYILYTIKDTLDSDWYLIKYLMDNTDQPLLKTTIDCDIKVTELEKLFYEI